MPEILQGARQNKTPQQTATPARISSTKKPVLPELAIQSAWFLSA
jgi:hypothetical protein